VAVSGTGSETAETAVSDKIFWHRYLPFYEPYFERLGDAAWVMEYGVDRGASIAYLSRRFEHAQVLGCDIIEPRPEWPRSPRIGYATVDQGDRASLSRLLERFPGPYDLVIEDGSHQPAHQAYCLVATLPHIRPGGVYVLEDLHTSHPEYRPAGRRGRGRSGHAVNCYQLLLAFEHLLALGRPLTAATARLLSQRSLFTEAEVAAVFARITAVGMFRRATLPLRCYRCGSDDFSYPEMRCQCGVPLIGGADSMAAVLTVGEPGAAASRAGGPPSPYAP
jgi:hypothetical protein